MEKSLIAEWERQGQVGVLAVNNPPQNYLSRFQLVNLEDLRSWTADDSLKGMIVTGRGRHFSAGFDREDLLGISDGRRFQMELRKHGEMTRYLEQMPIPVVAAINGVCFGAGLELAMSCHIRVCSEKALLSFPEAGYGIIPGMNGVIRLPQRIGTGRALEIVLTGRIIHADEALELGIVDYVVPPKELIEFTRSMLEKATEDRSLDVIRSIMTAVNNSRKMPLESATKRETEIFAKLVARGRGEAREHC